MKKLVILVASLAMFENTMAKPSEDNPINAGKNHKHHAKVKLAKEKGVMTSGLSLAHTSDTSPFPARNNHKLKQEKSTTLRHGASIATDQPAESASRFPTKSKYNYKLGGKR